MGFKRKICLSSVAFLIGLVFLLAAHLASAQNLQAFTKPEPVPDCTLKNLEGKTVSFKDFQGEVILLNFWTTW